VVTLPWKGLMFYIFCPPPPVTSSADRKAMCFLFLANLFVWWGLSCDFFPLLFPSLLWLAAAGMEIGSVSSLVAGLVSGGFYSRSVKNWFRYLILNWCLGHLAWAAGMESSRKPCCRIWN
jgi:hypothetical protein